MGNERRACRAFPKRKGVRIEEHCARTCGRCSPSMYFLLLRATQDVGTATDEKQAYRGDAEERRDSAAAVFIARGGSMRRWLGPREACRCALAAQAWARAFRFLAPHSWMRMDAISGRSTAGCAAETSRAV
jgi:hypothetical protein